jgi:hypothetical protein
MSKELPYFKFYTSAWINGDITLESYEIQGLFINICAYYWSKDGYVTMGVLLKKFKGYENEIDQLEESDIIKVNDGCLDISFLNEQLDSKQLQKYVNQKNGSKGGRPKKEETENKPIGFLKITELKANVNPLVTNIDYRKEDKTIEKKIREDIVEMLSPFDVAFNDFLDMRKKMRKPPTEKAIELIKKSLNNLAETEEDKILILEQSIKKSWLDVFPLKQDYQKEKGSAEKEKVSKFQQNNNSVHEANRILEQLHTQQR